MPRRSNERLLRRSDPERTSRYRTTKTFNAQELNGPDFLFWCFLVFYLTRLLQLGIRYPILGDIRAEFLLGIIVSAPAVIRLFQDKIFLPPRSFTVGLCFTALMFLMVPLSVAPLVSWNAFSNYAFKDMLVGLCIASFVTSMTRLRIFFAAHLLGFAKMAAEGVIGTITGGMIWENQGTMRLHGATPRYGHPNSFGGTQACTIPFLVALIPNYRLLLVRLLLLAQITAAGYVIIHTGSRSTYFALMVWGAFLILRSQKKARALITAAVCVGVLSVITPPEYIERFSQIFTQKDKDGGSVEARKEINSDALAIFLSHPLGVGVAAFPVIRNETFGRTQDAHNLYFEVATNLGIQGLALFIYLLTCLFRDLNGVSNSITESRRLLVGQRERDPQHWDSLTRDLDYLSLMSSALVSFLIIRLAFGIFGHDLYEPYWWFSIGLTVVFTRLSRQLLSESVALNRAIEVARHPPTNTEKRRSQAAG
jgi:putative inorganic carbon (hco3(-)) transporter